MPQRWLCTCGETVEGGFEQCWYGAAIQTWPGTPRWVSPSKVQPLCSVVREANDRGALFSDSPGQFGRHADIVARVTAQQAFSASTPSERIRAVQVFRHRFRRACL
jgi:hypothetical protein